MKLFLCILCSGANFAMNKNNRNLNKKSDPNKVNKKVNAV